MIEKLFRSIIPTVLITLPIGSVYAFSLFSPLISEYIGESLGRVQFAFSLSIFFLGMGAAFFGPLVERNIKLAGIVAAALFGLGCLMTSCGICFKSIWTIYLGYGVLNGLGQGIGYIVPVKTLMLWFPKHKGLAAAVSIISFGLGSSLCSWLFSVMFSHIGIVYLFSAFGAIYWTMMTTGANLIKKPAAEAISKVKDSFSYISLLKDSFFIKSWLFMFLNISTGLALIGITASYLKEVGIDENMVIFILIGCGIANGAGRLVFAGLSDLIYSQRLMIWVIIPAVSLAVSLGSYFQCLPAICCFAWIVNACYGAGFSTLPGILSDHYGNDRLSTIHGVVLSAWGVAGLVGNQFSVLIKNMTGGFWMMPGAISVIYVVILMLAFSMFKKECCLTRRV